jgi:hypothetical protein
MGTQTVAGERILVPFDQAGAPRAPWCCRAELSYNLLDEEGTLIDRLIDFAFDTIGAQTLDMRVTTTIHCQVMITVQNAPLSAQF